MQPQVLNPLGMTTQRTIVYSQSGAWWDADTPPEFAEVYGTLGVDATATDAQITGMVQHVLQFDGRN